MVEAIALCLYLTACPTWVVLTCTGTWQFSWCNVENWHTLKMQRGIRHQQAVANGSRRWKMTAFRVHFKRVVRWKLTIEIWPSSVSQFSNKIFSTILYSSNISNWTENLNVTYTCNINAGTVKSYDLCGGWKRGRGCGWSCWRENIILYISCQIQPEVRTRCNI